MKWNKRRGYYHIIQFYSIKYFASGLRHLLERLAMIGTAFEATVPRVGDSNSSSTAFSLCHSPNSMMSLVCCSSCCSFLAFSSSAFFKAACTFALRAVTISSRRFANDALTLFTSRLAALRIASWVLASFP